MTVMRACLSFLTVAVAAACFAQSSVEDDFILSGSTAYGMINAIPVAGAFATSLQWSDSGKYLLVRRMDLGSPNALQELIANPNSLPATTEESILVYSASDQKSSILWRSRIAENQLQDLKWFKGSDTAIATVVQHLRTVDPNHPNPTREQIVLIDVRSGSSKVIYSVDQENNSPNIRLELAPAKPYGVLATQWSTNNGSKPEDAQWHFNYRIISADGTVGQPVTVDEAAFISGWTEDGASPVLMLFDKGKDGKMRRNQRALDMATGKFVEVPNPRSFEPPVFKAALHLGPGNGTAGFDRAKRDLRSAWLVNESGDSQAMVSSDVTDITLSPTLNAVAYVSQGVAMVRPIIQIPKDLYLKAKQAAEKTRAIVNAKQLGLALLMYAADSDEALPPSQADVAKLLEPYTKNPGLFTGFVYTFGGGLTTDIKDPANTQLGYVSGPGGKAVVYADGHVKWQADQ